MTRMIDESYYSLIEYLQSYSLVDVIPHKELRTWLKTLHKYVYSLLCWQVALLPFKKQNMIWFNEAISDFIQVCSLLAQGHYKVCKVMHRSGIENFMKFTITESETTLPEGGVYKLFETAKEVSLRTWGAGLKSRTDDLHTMYGTLCNYVHTSNEEYCTFSQTLAEYPAYNTRLLSETTRELVHTLHRMNACVAIMEPTILRQMYYANKDAILDCMTATEKRDLV